MKINYHNKQFRVATNSENGETSSDTVFEYHQEGNILTSAYAGGQIKKGHLIGIVDENGVIEMRYHQINLQGELKTGKCISTPEVLENGKIRLHEEWEWTVEGVETTVGEASKGSSILEEL
ncbi:n-acetylglutamate synthase [Wenyingzhuangia sp. IMCC45574]